MLMSRSNRVVVVIVPVVMAVCALAQAQAQAGVPAVPSATPATALDTTPKITFGGFIDGYYAFDFNRPASFDRAYTTQPARHNEFNVNLAFVEAKVDAPSYRGRLALQTGTSVQSNYAGEPRNGSISGPDLSRFIQEAFVGVKLADNLWVDGGIFLSHIGMESFISRDNPMYTRSLVADYSPYYESGARLTWQPTSTVTAMLVVVNGWQIISETNSAKSVGVHVDYAPTTSSTFTWFNYFGDEAPDSATRHQYRFYNGVGIKSSLTSQFVVMAEADYGTQVHATDDGHSSWYGGMLTGRYQATPLAAIVARVERYDDRDQVIIATGTPSGLRANGLSLGVDVAPQPRVTWRTELRGLRGDNAVFPKRSGSVSTSDAFVVTSLGLTF
jgi:hypothetical protein